MKSMDQHPLNPPAAEPAAGTQRKRSLIKGFFYGFAKEERGSIAVEAVLILPMMFWTFLVVFSTFHAFRTYSVNQKAAYVIGDMISRETNPIDQEYLAGTRQLLSFLSNTRVNDVSVRVTAVKYNAGASGYERVWSNSRGFAPAATPADVSGWHEHLPVMPDNEVVIVVQTYHNYEPPFDVGYLEREVRNFVFTRPRYAPQILWEAAN